MYMASSYVRAESLDEAWELNQKRNNKIMGGNCWLRMGKNNNINTIISLSKLGLDKIEENDDAQTGHDKFQELIKTYPELGGILVSSMSGTQGVGLAIDEMGLNGEIAAVGTCIVSVSGDYLESGALTATTFWDPAGAGYALNKVALMALEGEKLEEGTDLGYSGYEAITMQDNVIYGTDVEEATADTVDEYPF